MSWINRSQPLTKKITTLIFCLVILIMFVLIWLLLADINLLHLQWLIPYHGKEWSGKITDDNYINIYNTYQNDIKGWDKSLDTPSAFKDYVYNNFNHDGYITILSNDVKFNPLILIPIISLFSLSIVIPFVLYLYKKMNIDIFVFSLPITVSSTIFIFCGFIPGVTNNGWLFFLRIVIFLVSLIITFIITNLIVNFVIGNSASNEQAIVDIVNQEKERRASQKALRDLKEQYKKQDDLTYIDIDKDD